MEHIPFDGPLAMEVATRGVPPRTVDSEIVDVVAVEEVEGGGWRVAIRSHGTLEGCTSVGGRSCSFDRDMS